MRLRHALAALALPALGASCAPTTIGSDFHAVERRLLDIGKLRTERSPSDAPFSNADLATNFGRIAFGLEPDLNVGRSKTTLDRWEKPVRWRIHAAPPERDPARRDVVTTMETMARVTGLDIAEAEPGTTSNMDILFLGVRDYERMQAWAEMNGAALDAELIGTFRTNAQPCRGRIYSRAQASDTENAGAIGYVLILIRAGLSPAFRLSCVEEEVAQSFGVANDDFMVRPSIFNDDEEFALLTTHDELLLRILYDPRLNAGMSRTEAMPLVARIVEDLRPGY